MLMNGGLTRRETGRQRASLGKQKTRPTDSREVRSQGKGQLSVSVVTKNRADGAVTRFRPFLRPGASFPAVDWFHLPKYRHRGSPNLLVYVVRYVGLNALKVA